MKNNKTNNGKGSRPRNCFSKAFKENYEEINWRNNKDKSLIPKGDYCYTWIETPSVENKFRGKVKNCPYFKYKEMNGVKVPWCDYLECGGLPNNGGEINKIRKYYGSEEKMDKELPLFLLFDGVKECGENKWEDETILE